MKAPVHQTFKYSEGQKVAIREHRPQLGLRAGDEGEIWALYASDPPEYEVTFWPVNAEPFDLTVEEDEIVAVPASRRLAAAPRREKPAVPFSS